MPRLIAWDLGMLISGWIAYRLQLAVTPIVDNREHYVGDRLVRSKVAVAAANRLAARKARRGEWSIDIAPNIKLSREREVRNVLLLVS